MTRTNGDEGASTANPTGSRQGDQSTGGNPESDQASRVGDHENGTFDTGDFLVDHNVDPPEEVQPTTTS
jgi:hypothetical protein